MSGIEQAPWYSPLLSLRWRLAFVYSALFSIFVILLSIFLYRSTSTLLLQNAQSLFPQQAQGLRALLIQQACDTNPPESLATFTAQNASNDIDDIYLLDRNGQVIVSSHKSFLNQPFPYLKASTFGNSSTFGPSVTGGIRTFHSNIHGSSGSDGVLFALNAPSNCMTTNNLPSYMVVLTSYEKEQSTLRMILLMLVTTALIMVVTGALIISFFTGVMFSPLKQVTNATLALAQGDLQQRVPTLPGRDEISTLAISFNQMADQIEHMFAAQQDSERRSRRFVSDASHELRTPITSLRGFTEVLIRGAKDDPKTAQHILSLMKTEAERMTELVNDLLTLARFDEGHFPVPTGVDLVDLAVETLQEARKNAPDSYKLALELATQERLKTQASREPLRQLLLELLDNAVKYGCTEKDKLILLRLDKKEQHALLQIVDHGVGIPPADLPHIFDRFYRGANAHNANRSPIPGTGLGLPIAMAIVQAYSGTLTASSHPNEETIFTLSFLCSE